MEAKKLLVVVDYQNDFVCGTLGFPGADAIDAGIAQTVQAYLAVGDPVVFTYDTHGADYLETREGRALPIAHCSPDTDGWMLFGLTQAQLSDTCCNGLIRQVRKETFGMPPEAVLSLRQEFGAVEEIRLVGVVTNMCVISNAVVLQAAWPEAQIVVDASLCLSFDPALHEKALDVMEGLQMQVINR